MRLLSAERQVLLELRRLLLVHVVEISPLRRLLRAPRGRWLLIVKVVYVGQLGMVGRGQGKIVVEDGRVLV